jgi:hypothetical protein
MAPSAGTTIDDSLLSITWISVADADAATGAVKLPMSVAHGWLALAQVRGLTFTVVDGTSDATMTFTAAVADVNRPRGTRMVYTTGNRTTLQKHTTFQVTGSCGMATGRKPLEEKIECDAHKHTPRPMRFRLRA